MSGRKKTFFPKYNTIQEIIRTHPERVYRDAQGRLYGRIEPTNALWQRLKDAGEIESNTEPGRALLWVYLPHRASGPFAAEKRNQALLVGEDLVFPSADEVRVLYHFFVESEVMRMEILFYPEKIAKGGKTGAVVCRIRSGYI